jgi:hypothetical protein
MTKHESVLGLKLMHGSCSRLRSLPHGIRIWSKWKRICRIMWKSTLAARDPTFMRKREKDGRQLTDIWFVTDHHLLISAQVEEILLLVKAISKPYRLHKNSCPTHKLEWRCVRVTEIWSAASQQQKYRIEGNAVPWPMEDRHLSSLLESHCNRFLLQISITKLH